MSLFIILISQNMKFLNYLKKGSVLSSWRRAFCPWNGRDQIDIFTGSNNSLRSSALFVKSSGICGRQERERSHKRLTRCISTRQQDLICICWFETGERLVPQQTRHHPQWPCDDVTVHDYEQTMSFVLGRFHYCIKHIT